MCLGQPHLQTGPDLPNRRPYWWMIMTGTGLPKMTK